MTADRPLDLQRMARMAEADNWLHPPQPRRRRALWLGLAVVVMTALGFLLGRIACLE